MPQICGVAKKSKTLNFGNIFTGNMVKLPYTVTDTQRLRSNWPLS